MLRVYLVRSQSYKPEDLLLESVRIGNHRDRECLYLLHARVPEPVLGPALIPFLVYLYYG